jgi:hypothetical protein
VGRSQVGSEGYAVVVNAPPRLNAHVLRIRRKKVNIRESIELSPARATAEELHAEMGRLKNLLEPIWADKDETAELSERDLEKARAVFEQFQGRLEFLTEKLRREIG